MKAPAASGQAGLLIALAGFSSLSIADAIVKSMAGAWPGTAISALRFVLGTVVLGVVIAWRNGRAGFVCPRPWLQLGRGLAIATGSVCFFLAVHLMPIADATAIQFTSPVITALLSAVLLRERPPRAVWGATVLALCGMLIVLRPNLLAIGWAGLLPLGTAAGMSALILLNRAAAGTASALQMQFLVSAFAAPTQLLAATVGHWSGLPMLRIPMPSTNVILLCVALTAVATLAHLLIYLATTRVAAAIMAPMTYVQLLMAALLGWAFFGDRPGLPLMVGAALIVAGGLWLWRSQAERR